MMTKIFHQFKVVIFAMLFFLVVSVPMIANAAVVNDPDPKLDSGYTSASGYFFLNVYSDETNNYPCAVHNASTQGANYTTSRKCMATYKVNVWLRGPSYGREVAFLKTGRFDGSYYIKYTLQKIYGEDILETTSTYACTFPDGWWWLDSSTWTMQNRQFVLHLPFHIKNSDYTLQRCVTEWGAQNEACGFSAIKTENEYLANPNAGWGSPYFVPYEWCPDFVNPVSNTSLANGYPAFNSRTLWLNYGRSMWHIPVNEFHITIDTNDTGQTDYFGSTADYPNGYTHAIGGIYLHRIPCTLTYHANNPTSTNDVSLSATTKSGKKGAAWGTLATASKPHYVFKGWYLANGTTQVTANTICTGNVDVYAKWERLQYTLTYNTNNPNSTNNIGLSPNRTSQTVNEGSAWGTLVTPSKEGYTFKGWYTAKTGGSQISASTVPTSSYTVYARWQANNYTLTYDGNHPNDAATDASDMSISKTSQTGTYDQKWGSLATASKPGCQFLGWYTAKTGGTQVTANTICKGNLTVYGRWKVILYTLTYDKNNPSPVSDASNISVSKPNNQVKYSQAWGELATASKRGYTFLGWFTAKSGGQEILPTDVNNADLTAYAHWEPNPYTMTYHKNNPPTALTDDSNIELSKESQTVLFDQPWGELATAEKHGYTFLGWFTDPVNGTQITKDTLVDHDIDVYAHWTPVIYTLTYDKNNPPTARTDDSNVILSKTSQTAPFDSTWGSLATASKTGYTFLGWFTERTDGEQITKDTVVEGDLRVYAHWRVNQYVVRFHPNTEHAGDTPIVEGDMPSITVKYDELRNLPVNTFTKTTLIPPEDEGGETLRLSSVFKGWSTNKAAITPALADQAQVLNWSSTDGDVIDLYAIWDDAPKFNVVDYPDRYFTLEEAQDGDITEEELLKTVKVYDRETNPIPPKPSGTPGPGVSVVGYDPDEFTSLTDDSSILIRYKVEDESGNKTYLNVIVYVSRNANFDTSRTPYLRSISNLYADKSALDGGLSDESQWRVDSTYSNSLTRAMTSTTSIYDVRLNKAQLKKIREYIDANGLGNSENPNALREFRNYVNY